jgi:hypothetical protein
MAQNIGEIATILAIAIISIVFALYLIILRKNGWLGGKSDFYRCPNQECNKIFQKPIELKDLSMSPPRTYLACPECGANLESFFNSIPYKIPKIKPKTLSNQKKNEIKPIEKKTEARGTTTNQQPKQPSVFIKKTPTMATKTETKSKPVQRVETSNQNQEQLLMPRQKVTIANSEVKPIENITEVKTAETSTHHKKMPFTHTEKTPISKTSKDISKINSADHFRCEYYFGYLATINIKKDGTPSICLECPRTLECLLRT